MKPSPFVYRRAADVAEALSLLRQAAGEAKPLAGGQSLIPAMNLRLATPAMLVDLAGIAGLSELALDGDGSLRAGAMVTHARFLRDERVGAGWPIMAKVLRHVAHEQIRHRGTMGGSLCHADPAAEWAALCVLLDAQMRIAGEAGTRAVAAADFQTGVYETALREHELLTEVRFPAVGGHWRWGMHEIARRRGDFALAGAMVGLALDGAQRIEALRLVVFGVEDRARRLDADLAHLLGRPLDRDAREAAAVAAALAVVPRSDLHASAELRLDLVQACVARALDDAVATDNSGATHP